jgi:hypothetical protein
MTTLHPSSADEICVGCAVKNDPGQLAFNLTAPVKQENSAAAATQTLRPPFVAVWQPTVGSSLDPIRLDLRCDVFGMMLASKPPATAAKIVIAQERVSQGHLHPSLGPDQSLVLQFETTASRQLFVDAVKYWKLDADGIAALRQAVAAAASIGVTGVLASEDVKPPPSADAATPGGPSSRELRLPPGVEIIPSAQRAKERAWVAHDSGLRQLFAGLVTQGLITEEEFDLAHSEEKSAFFAEETTHQPRGVSSLQDALAALVDPDTFQLRPITEQVAANVFAQSPALARIYRIRVASQEDEIVFWDAVVRRALFLSRTILDEHDHGASSGTGGSDSTAATSAAVVPVARAAAAGALEALQETWNARSNVAIERAVAADMDAGVSGRQVGAKAPRDEDAYDTLRTDRIGGFVVESDGERIHRRLRENLDAALLLQPSDAPRHPVRSAKQLYDTYIRPALVISDSTAAAANGDAVSVWDELISVTPVHVVLQWDGSSYRGADGSAHGGVSREALDSRAPVPSELRTFHSLHRLSFRQLLSAAALSNQPTPPSPAVLAAARKRCTEILATMKRALGKVVEEPGVADALDPRGDWAAAARHANAMCARAAEVHATVAESWGRATTGTIQGLL